MIAPVLVSHKFQLMPTKPTISKYLIAPPTTPLSRTPPARDARFYTQRNLVSDRRNNVFPQDAAIENAVADYRSRQPTPTEKGILGEAHCYAMSTVSSHHSETISTRFGAHFVRFGLVSPEPSVRRVRSGLLGGPTSSEAIHSRDIIAPFPPPR